MSKAQSLTLFVIGFISMASIILSVYTLSQKSSVPNSSINASYNSTASQSSDSSSSQSSSSSSSLASSQSLRRASSAISQSSTSASLSIVSSATSSEAKSISLKTYTEGGNGISFQYDPSIWNITSTDYTYWDSSYPPVQHKNTILEPNETTINNGPSGNYLLASTITLTSADLTMTINRVNQIGGGSFCVDSDTIAPFNNTMVKQISNIPSKTNGSEQSRLLYISKQELSDFGNSPSGAVSCPGRSVAAGAFGRSISVTKNDGSVIDLQPNIAETVIETIQNLIRSTTLPHVR